MQFKNIKPTVITVLVLVVIIIAGVSFSGKAIGGVSLASLSSAKQLISSNSQDKISKLDDNEKQKLIEKIDEELTQIGIELTKLNRENADAKKQLAAQQSSYSANTAQINSLISQTQSLQNRLSQQQNQLKNKNQQCAKVAQPQKPNCRKQANEISSRISATRSELNQKQATLNNIKAESGKINFQALQNQIAEKQKRIAELEGVVGGLNELRRDVVNSTNNNNNNNDPIEGCMDINATNWNPSATVDDGSCEYKSEGCTDESAINYNSTATVDDGSCLYSVYDYCEDEEGLDLLIDHYDKKIANHQAELDKIMAERNKWHNQLFTTKKDVLRSEMAVVLADLVLEYSRLRNELISDSNLDLEKCIEKLQSQQEDDKTPELEDKMKSLVLQIAEIDRFVY